MFGRCFHKIPSIPGKFKLQNQAFNTKAWKCSESDPQNEKKELKLTKWMMPAAVSQTEMKMEMSWASLSKRSHVRNCVPSGSL